MIVTQLVTSGGRPLLKALDLSQTFRNNLVFTDVNQASGVDKDEGGPTFPNHNRS